MLIDLLAWFFICRDEDAYLQVKAFSQKPSLNEAFNLYHSQYIPAPFERLGGYSVKNKLATNNVRLLFLINNVSLDKDNKENFDEASDLALTLDRVDFSVDDYLVDSMRYPLIGKVLLRGKEKAAVVDDDEEDVEDIGGVGGSPSSSTVNLRSDDSLNDIVLLGHANNSYSVNGDFAWPNRNLDVSDFDLLNILERPSSMPAGPGGSSTKRRG